MSFKDGGAVPVSDVVLPPPAVADVPALASSDDDDALLGAVRATHRAEEAQRDAIDKLPISDHKKDFVRQFPFLLEQENAQRAARHYHAGLAQGIADDSDEMNRHILNGIASDLGSRRVHAELPQQPILPAELPPELTPPPLVERTSAPLPAPSFMAELPAPEPPPRRKMPISAPVSRDVPMSSGKRESDQRRITLSAEERLIARNSFGAIKGENGRLVDLTNAQKEALYARNKALMLKMKAEGKID